MTSKLFKDSPKPFKLKENSDRSSAAKSVSKVTTEEISKTDMIASDNKNISKIIRT